MEKKTSAQAARRECRVCRWRDETPDRARRGQGGRSAGERSCHGAARASDRGHTREKPTAAFTESRMAASEVPIAASASGSFALVNAATIRAL